MVSGYAHGGDDPEKALSLVPGAVDDTDSFLAAHPETSARLARVSDLVEGFETPFGLELLSTVHWVVTRDGVVAPAEVAARVYEWNHGKRQFTARQIALAVDVLRTRRLYRTSRLIT